MLKIINAVLRWFAVDLIAVYLSPELVKSAKTIMSQTALMPGSGEFKRAQALRALMNRHPEARERECALTIELVVQEAV